MGADRLVHERLHDRDRVVRREQLESSGIGRAWGSRIEDAASSERRPVAEDDPVVTRRDHRSGEPQLREALPDSHDPGEGFRRPVMHVHPRVVADRLELRQARRRGGS